MEPPHKSSRERLNAGDISPPTNNNTTNNDFLQSNNSAGTDRAWWSYGNGLPSDVVGGATATADLSPLSQQQYPPSRLPESAGADHDDQQPLRAIRVSFAESVEPSSNRRSNAEPEEVLLCSSNNSFQKKSKMIRCKTKSRLMYQPEEKPRKSLSGKSDDLSGKGSDQQEKDDQFIEDDLPEHYKMMKYNCVSIMQLVCLILLITAIVCSLTIDRLKKHTTIGLRLWKWEFMVLVLVSGRLVSGWAIRIIVRLIEGNFLLRKRVLFFIYGLKKSVQNCLWLALIWIAWNYIFVDKIEKVANTKVLSYVSKVWVCLLVGTFIWLVKTLVVKVLASSFHVSTFFDRIQEALFSQYVIETLSGPPLIEIQQEVEAEEKVMVEVEKLQNEGATVPDSLKANLFKSSGRIVRSPPKKIPKSKAPKKASKNGITIDLLHRLNQNNISAWNMKRLMSAVRKGALSIRDEEMQGNTDDERAVVNITNENQAKTAATKIFVNVAKPGTKHIFLEDLMRFVREDEAIRIMGLFSEGTEERGISKSILRNLLVTAFRERRALALSLNDTKTAVNKLHKMLNIMVAILIVVVWLLILKVATTHFLVFLSSQVLLVVFMFGNTCKTTFEAIIFLFVMHPFDVGDRVEVEGIQMIVEEMNILTTVFLKFDNHKIYYPNSVLCTMPIHNYYRSPDMGDAIDFSIHISTPGEKIATMKERLTRFINNRSDHWYADPMIVMRDVDDMNRVMFSIWLSHKMNHQDMGERWVRRAHVVDEMLKTFRDLDIEYRMLPLDVNVRNISSNRLPSNWNACAPD